MATLQKLATGAAVAASGFNGAWTSEANVRDGTAASPDNNTYATVVNPGRNKEFASLWPFVFSELDPADSIISVTVELQWKAASNSTFYTLSSSLFADSGQVTAITAVPALTNNPCPTVDTTRSYSASPTAAQLINGVWVRVQAAQGATNTGTTFSLDFIRVTVNYTPAIKLSLSDTITLSDAISKNPSKRNDDWMFPTDQASTNYVATTFGSDGMLTDCHVPSSRRNFVPSFVPEAFLNLPATAS